MKKVCKTVFCVIAILLLGFLSQQEIKAGEASERHYSKRAYSVLSANVGNFKHRGAARSKLQSGSDEEARVRFWIDKLKPDIVILIEACNYEQADSVTGHSYSIHGGPPYDFTVHNGPYDFICVKKDIIATKDGKQDIKHVGMGRSDGNNVGYVDVGLKNEEGRKARLFYAHFPSPQLSWSLEEHAAHKNAFNWICDNLKPDVPCLIAGDLNNDFTRGKSQIDNEAALITNPLLAKKYREEQAKIHSSLYIEKQVKNLKLWIFNPLAQPLQLQLLDGSTEHNYEATWRIPPEVVWKTTIDWVMGKNVVPPFLAPGGPKTDLVAGTTGTIRTNLITSPPDWWKGTGIKDVSRLKFDHKPLYGKVVFFWEKRIQPDILGKWVVDNIHLAEIVTLQFEQDGTALMNGPFGSIRIRDAGCNSGQWEISQGSRIDFSFTDPFPGQKELKATGQIDDDTVREFKINDLGEGFTLIKVPNTEAVKTTPKGKVWSEYVDEHPQYGMTWRLKIRADKTFLATVSRACRWKIESDGLVKLYDKDEKGNDIGLWAMEVRDNKLVDKTCGSRYVRAKKGGKQQ